MRVHLYYTDSLYSQLNTCCGHHGEAISTSRLYNSFTNHFPSYNARPRTGLEIPQSKLSEFVGSNCYQASERCYKEIHSKTVTLLLPVPISQSKKFTFFKDCHWGCMGGAVMKALAVSHQCGPGSIPGFYAICGLSLLVLHSALRGFSPGTPVFPYPQKPTIDWICDNLLISV